jgi:hypothetical protein
MRVKVHYCRFVWNLEIRFFFPCSHLFSLIRQRRLLLIVAVLLILFTFQQF